MWLMSIPNIRAIHPVVLSYKFQCLGDARENVTKIHLLSHDCLFATSGQSSEQLLKYFHLALRLQQTNIAIYTAMLPARTESVFGFWCQSCCFERWGRNRWRERVPHSTLMITAWLSYWRMPAVLIWGHLLLYIVQHLRVKRWGHSWKHLPSLHSVNCHFLSLSLK